MSGRSFRSVFMVASCAGAALGCYLVSLRVASERAALEDVETHIVLAQRDIRLLQTEIGTRGRLAQLERWNAKVIALSAPTADQFLKGGFELARMTTPEPKAAIEAPVILASAPAPAAAEGPRAPMPSRTVAQGPAAMLHEASLKTSARVGRDAPLPPRAPTVSSPKDEKPAAKVTTQKTAPKAPTVTTATKPELTSSPKNGSLKKVAKPVLPAKAGAPKVPSTKAVKVSSRDPLAPLPESRTKMAAVSKVKSSKDLANKQ